jgi:hypothetical protein
VEEEEEDGEPKRMRTEWDIQPASRDGAPLLSPNTAKQKEDTHSSFS